MIAPAEREQVAVTPYGSKQADERSEEPSPIPNQEGGGA